MDRRKFNSMVASLAVAGSCPLRAQERYPSRPVRIIVPFAPGGIGDQVARSVGTPLGELLGQSVIVENRPGGDSVTGTVYSAKSQADGYTIMQVSTPQSINMVLREKPGFDLLKDFQPIARVVQGNLVLVVPVSSPARNVAELVNMGKNKSGGLSFGSGGVGSVGHLSGELLKRFANITAMHIPYKGNAAVLPDLIGGRLDFFSLPSLRRCMALALGSYVRWS
jgi:tripartite-type tricarboxylate transporter receptor subunit TctC